MKPSERIKEIQEDGDTELNLDGPGIYYKTSKIEALIQYLDEQWEKEQCICPQIHKDGFKIVGVWKCPVHGKVEIV